MTSFMMEGARLQAVAAEIKRLEKHHRFNYKISMHRSPLFAKMLKIKNKIGSLAITISNLINLKVSLLASRGPGSGFCSVRN